MEAAGLAVGIASLFTACLEVLERVDAYKDFDVESHHALALFDAGKARLQRWGAEMDISGGRLKDPHDPRLDNPEINLVIRKLLDNAIEIFAEAESTRSRLHNSTEGEPKGPLDLQGDPKAQPLKRTKSYGPSLVKDRLRWALRSRGRFINHVDMLNKVVDSLHSLVPLDQDSIQAFSSEQLSKVENSLNHQMNFQTEIQTLLDNIRTRSRQEAEETIFRWLGMNRLDQKQTTQHQYERSLQNRLDGTCEWIFQHPVYKNWKLVDETDNEAKIFWLNGPAGHGKTVICAKIVEDFKVSGVDIGYFFASSHAESGGEPEMAVRCWIAQAVHNNSEIQELVYGYLNARESGQMAMEKEIWAIFEGLVSHNPDLTFFLDGFDEYPRSDDTRTRFLQKLKTAVANTRARIFISSRDETDIRAELSSKTRVTGLSTFECKISKEEVQHDIALFSKHVVDAKLSNKSEQVRSDLATMLADKCDGMFLWINLQKEKLSKGKNKKQLEQVVSNMPTGLSRTYERKWASIVNRAEEERARAESILRWTLFAARPLTIAEITEILLVELYSREGNLSLDDLPDAIDDAYIEEEIITVCEFLIEARPTPTDNSPSSMTIHFVHPSVREYMFSVLPSIKGVLFDALPGGFGPASNGVLARTCVNYLNFNESWICSQREESNTILRPFVDYAARSWFFHISESGNTSPEIVALVVRLLDLRNEKFLKWREYFNSTLEPGDERWWTHEKDAASPLYYAALFDLVSGMDQIYENSHAELNEIGGRYGTPLQAVCVKNNVASFEKLKGWNADPNIVAGEFGTAIIAASAQGNMQLVRELADLGADIELRDPVGRTALYSAVRGNHFEIVQFLIGKGANADARNKYDATVMNIAAYTGNVEVVRLLLDQGADLNTANSYGSTPLNTAADKGKVEVVKLLLDFGADLNTASNYGWTPLNRAAEKGNVEVVKLLLDSGAAFNTANNDGWTPINRAANRGHLEVAKLLLDRGADFATAGIHGWTPLNSAAESGHVEIVRLLLDVGADSKVATSGGWTPLTYAVRNNHLEVAKLLLDSGADLTTSVGDGWTPIKIAADEGYAEMLQLLIDRGADVTDGGADGWKPLHHAVFMGHFEATKLLLDCGSDPAVPNRSGWTSLNIAASLGHVNMVRLLLDRGADVTIADSMGCTPIDNATIRGHVEVAELLIARGADFKSIRMSGRTPLSRAAEEGVREVVKLPLEKGADADSKDTLGDTPLSCATNNKHEAVINLPLEKGADAKGKIQGLSLEPLTEATTEAK